MEDKQQLTYVQTLQQAQQAENDAIAIGLNLLTMCPQTDIAQIAEITNDENDHDRIYSQLLSKYQVDNAAKGGE